MREIILNVLSDIACSNTGNCQINMQSESAREMIANKLEKELDKYVNSMIEDIVCPPLEKYE
tara:strand:- start:444 stop:629 length:186 start_codon:yes stop_codon:yes gene_type:complete